MKKPSKKTTKKKAHPKGYSVSAPIVRSTIPGVGTLIPRQKPKPFKPKNDQKVYGIGWGP